MGGQHSENQSPSSILLVDFRRNSNTLYYLPEQLLHRTTREISVPDALSSKRLSPLSERGQLAIFQILSSQMRAKRRVVLSGINRSFATTLPAFLPSAFSCRETRFAGFDFTDMVEFTPAIYYLETIHLAIGVRAISPLFSFPHG